MKYIALDFETASSSMDSACSVGLVRMDEEGFVEDEFYSLICPKNPEFDPRCFSVHHLDPLSVLAAPSIEAIWPEMRDFIADRPLVAHNAFFDITVLRTSLSSWGLEPVHNPYYCTLSLSRKLWKGRRSYRLPVLAEDMGWEYEAHNALDDSRICGRLFSRLCGSALYDDETAKRFFQRVYRDGSYPKYV